MQAALNGLMVGRTTVVVAHRLSTIVNADRIAGAPDHACVMSGCAASVQGTHVSIAREQRHLLGNPAFRRFIRKAARNRLMATYQRSGKKQGIGLISPFHSANY